MLRLLLALALPAFAAPKPKGARVHGRVVWKIGDQSVDTDEMAVFLIPLDDQPQDAAAAPEPQMAQKNMSFEPKMLVISRGQTVRFPNEDDMMHNVFSLSATKKFDLGTYPKGESKSVTFETEGAVTIYCSIHSAMKGRIFVAPSPYHALTDASGEFSIAGVPPGHYDLRTWHARLPALDKTVVVPEADKSGGAIEVDLAPTDRAETGKGL